MIEIVREELTRDRKEMIDTLKELLMGMILTKVQQVGIRNVQDGSYCKHQKHVCKAFRNCTSRDEALQFWKVFYDFEKDIPNWKIEVSSAAMIHLGWVFVPEEILNWKGITFAERLASHVLNEYRKGLNKYGAKGNPGYRLSKCRDNESKEMVAPETDYVWPEYIKCLEVSNYNKVVEK
jgi:hypothetical protein